MSVPHNIKLIRAYFVLFPLMYVLGIDKVFWIFYLLLSLVVLLVDKSLRGFAFERLMLVLFFVCALITLLFISEEKRIITWVWDVGVIIYGGLLFLAVINLEKSQIEQYVIKPLLVFFVFISIYSLFSIVLNNPFEFKSVLYHFMPSGLRGTSFGEALFVKQVYTDAYFSGLNYNRLKSVFSYATSFAVASVAVLVYMYATNIWRKNVRYFLMALVIIVLLVFTTSRTAFLAIMLSFAFVFMVRNKMIFSVLLCAVMFVLVAYFNELNQAVTESLERFVEMRGGGSSSTRLEIYTQTLQKISENYLGYGSALDVPDLYYPLGSHSTILGVTFKFGIAGMFFLSLFFVSTMLNSGVPSLHKPVYPMLIAMSVISVFEEIYLDSLSATILAVIFGAVVKQSYVDSEASLCKVNRNESSSKYFTLNIR